MRAVVIAIWAGLAVSPVLAVEEGKLLVWTTSDMPYSALETIGQRFTAETGIPVTVEHPDDLVNQFQKLASLGDGPDIVLHTHDNFGVWSAAGLIFAVEPQPELRAGSVDVAWDAMTIDGATWGWPLTMDVICLFYNKALVSAPPADFSELARLNVPDGVSPILWELNNIYYSMPLLMANGGYAFRKDDAGVFNRNDTGVNNEGARAGAAVLASLVSDGVLPQSVDYATAETAMMAGETAMTINGQWAFWGLQSAGIDVGVAPLPAVNGSPSPVFVGVQGFAISAASPNAALAQQFIEDFVFSDDGMDTLDQSGGLTLVANKRLNESRVSDAVYATWLEIAESGVPMPTTPAMGKFWAAMGLALSSITSGAKSVDDALDGAAARILAP